MMTHQLLAPLSGLSSDLLSALPTFSSIFYVGLAAFFSLWAMRRFSSHPRNLPYPPGPPSKSFILGNAADLSDSKLWFPMVNWASIYGPIMYFRSLNKHIIVLNTEEDATELLEKRSSIFSDRSYFPLIDLVGWTFSTPFKHYGSEWQRHRRFLQQMFRAGALVQYRGVQIEKVNDMMHSIYEAPEDFMTHVKTYSTAIVMSAMYGYKVSPKDDYFTQLAEDAMVVLSVSSYPGASIVNILPFLRYLPSWFPGAGFHRTAKVGLNTVTRMQDVPYKYVQDNMAAGTALPSFVSENIENCKTEDDHKLLKAIAATGYAGGADTTTASIIAFIHAMAEFPEVQRKAQEEIDRVIGHDKLVTFEDEASLPYIHAICREVFRWRPVTPLGNFHASIAEDVYKGYYIPKGTTIIPNIWAMSRNSEKYKDPERFDPDRFFTESGELNKDDVNYTFGFGRRICPGRHMAFATVWLAIASTLSAFDIRPSKDASGKNDPLKVEYSGGMISHPLPFECSIAPRSERMKQLLIDLNNNRM
ncbi:cytochrome P450 [Pholiota conissans]|uniref:Cytochrome P450 n=1 Tax=Pholiota conissans TaxID=109636 RepID=A0A9P5Z6K4_9AGAR|nr:cytochrome P450 [Pholiota conissans]